MALNTRRGSDRLPQSFLIITYIQRYGQDYTNSINQKKYFNLDHNTPDQPYITLNHSFFSTPQKKIIKHPENHE